MQKINAYYDIVFSIFTWLFCNSCASCFKYRLCQHFARQLLSFPNVHDVYFFEQMVAGRKICKNIKNNENSQQKLENPINIFEKTRGGVKTVVGSEMSLVIGIFMAKRNLLPWKWRENPPCFLLHFSIPSTSSSNIVQLSDQNACSRCHVMLVMATR